jgi:hypothetical protein
MIKKSSGEKVASGLIYEGPCYYYGFVCVTGGSNRTVKLYDNESAAAGTVIESFTADGNKPTDGHSHANPVHCENGIYLEMSGGTVVVFYSDIVRQSAHGNAKLVI